MRSIIFSIVSFAVLMLYGVSISAVTLPKPPDPPPYQSPTAGKSPGEIMAEKQVLLEKGIKNRKKRGLPVNENNVRLVDPLYEREFKAERDYSKQSCYHTIAATDPDDFAFCDAEKCTFPRGIYCEHKTRDCYDEDGKLIVNEKGLSVRDNTDLLIVDMCLARDGSLVTPPGEKSFDEKIKAGCGYRVRGTTPYFKYYLQGMNGYMMTCDKYRCIFHPPSATYYNRETKTFFQGENESKIPPYEYVPYLDWKCLNGKQANRVPKKYRCSLVTEDGENWGCEVCFENGKHVYKGCKYRYNEKGEAVEKVIHIIPELEEQLDEITQVRYQLMERNRVDIVRKMGDLEGIFQTTPATDAIQKKAVTIFQNFFDRKDEEGWTDAKLGQELAILRNKIRAVVRKK